MREMVDCTILDWDIYDPKPKKGEYDRTNRRNLVLLNCQSKEIYGLIPFKFNLLWLQNSSSMEVIVEAWKIVVKGSFFFVWESKIRVENSKLKDLDKFSTSHPLKVREEAEKN